MSAIRRASPKSDTWEDSLQDFSGERIVDISISSKKAHSKISDYPYEGQEVYKVDFAYLLDRPGNLPPKSVEMIFYYRTESDLWILDPGPRDNLTNEVIHEIKSELVGHLRILPGISASERGIWKFIDSAYETQTLTITDGFETVPFEELSDRDRDKLISSGMVSQADLVFKRGDNIINVSYSNDTVSINADSMDDFEYVVQRVEADLINA